MPDRNRPLNGILDDLAEVVNDLYNLNADAGTRLSRELQGSAASAAPAPLKPEPPELPPFRDLWKVADETIDWTEALASPTPTDGLTSPDRWALYHQHAAAVLQGDTDAYLTVLQAINPMGDLMPYVSSLNVTTAGPDALEAVFAVQPALLESRGREYLAGMALRIARDLVAALPVMNIRVTARQEARALLTVSFDRNQLRPLRFNYVDPVEVVLKMGGQFTDDLPHP